MRHRTLAAALFASVVLGAPAMVFAQPSQAELNHAREEFRRGMSLEQARDFEGALEVFKGVARVKSTPQVRFHIAFCEEQVGDWVGALGSYRLALLEAQEAKVKDVEEESNAAITALEPKIPKVTLVRGEGAVSARILLDGRELGATSLGAPIAMNPGPHQIVVSAVGFKTATIDIDVAAGETKEVQLTLEVDESAPPPNPVGPVGPTVTPDTGPSPLLPVGAATLAVGGAALVVSGVFYFALRQGAIDDLDAACGPDGQSCPADLVETRDNGELYSTISMATFIGGLAAAGLGGTLLIVEAVAKPGSGDTEEARSWSPFRLHVTPGGVWATGSF